MKLLYALAFILAIFAPIACCAAPAEIAIGDSIAVGLGLPGSAEIGIGPKAVLQRIAATPLNHLYGKIVILSSGVSNNPADIDYVPVQIEALQAAGAHVVLLGVGSHVASLAPLNALLGSYAGAAGIPFIWGWPAVHPASYRVLLENLRQVECHFYQLCSA